MLYRQSTNPRRQKLIRPEHGHAIPAGTRVFNDLRQLQHALQKAIALEHFTIPPYLCALYSIQERTNVEAARITRSVVVEEMLHMLLAANILNAIGGRPRISAPDLLPRYPRKMPLSEIGFQVNLLKFSKEAVNTFLRIERPAPRMDLQTDGNFWSIGEFYASVREALRRLDWEARNNNKKNGIFTGIRRQVTEEHYYGSGGKVLAVRSLEDAERAIDEIVGQGEGIDGTIEDADESIFGRGVEFAHYFRFNEIFNERRYRLGDMPDDAPSGEPLPIDWNAVYNMVPNPTIEMFEHKPSLACKAREFNQTYSALLQNIQKACDGEPEVLKEGIPLMHALRIAAIDLMNEPIGNGDYTAGPIFAFIP
jgi:hypothetical protein